MTTEYPSNSEAQEASNDNDIPAAVTSSQLTVVGIGASAGGLAALRGFFAAMPPDSGITFVVVVHLSPEHESMLAELLQSSSALPVTQVTARVQMMPNHVYVIPPGKWLLVRDSALELAELEVPQGPRMQIDLFFRSLAEVRGDGAAIILSGTGSDGAVGIQAIKEHGGLILVQAPEEAEYDGMPRNAIATGLVDAVGPVAELAQRLVTAKQIRVNYQLPDDAELLSAESQDTLSHILTELRTRTGHDFSDYKRPTILRRIGRRMQLTRQRTLTGYLHHLRQDGDEAQQLFRDLLIKVTQFFRDPEAWAALAQTVIPTLFADKTSRDTVRVWTAGCASGEEAYSLAILLLEQATLLNFAGKVQLFASDLSHDAIEHARTGTYPAAIAADVSKQRLARFFTQEDSHYRVRDEVREVVLFAQHNLLEDPSFSRVDLITCRNLLIYLQRDVQAKICDTFHYALRSDGYLFLGSAEAVEGITDLFLAVDRRQRIYQRHAGAREPRALPSVSFRPEGKPLPPRTPDIRRAQPPSAEVHRLRLEEIGPPSLLVDTHSHVLHLSETVGRYLEVRGGSPTVEVLQLVRPELQTVLRSALYRAGEQGKAVFVPAVPVQFNDAPHPVALWVRPVPGEAKQLLVLFLEDEEATVESVPTDVDRQHATVVQQLEAELLQSERALQEIDENYETTLEELRAANEELRSINEEYRSTLEELETGKEELQLVNQELNAKMDELSQAHGDLQNFVLATNIATLFLDRRLRIMRFTPGAAELFNLLPSDQNRLITDLRPKVQYEQLEADVHGVMANLTSMMREVQDVTGRWFLVQVRPYRTVKDKVVGVVITFTDVTASKELEVERQASDARFHQVWETTSDAMALSDAEGIVLAANPAYLELYGYSADQVVGQSFALIFPAETRQDAMEQYKQIFASEVNPATFESVVQHVDGSQRIVETRMTFLSTEGRRTAMLSTIRDITERKQAERERSMLASIVHSSGDAIVSKTLEGVITSWNTAAERMFGYTAEEAIGQSILLIIPPELQHEEQEILARLRRGERVSHYDTVRMARDGQRIDISLEISPMRDASGHIIGASKIARDITDRKQAEEALHQLNETLESRVQERTEQVRQLVTQLTMSEQEERRRISAILHDDLQQRLYGLNFQLTTLRRKLNSQQGEELRQMIDEIEEDLRESVQMTRNLSVDLSPPVLHNEGLDAALRWLAAQMEQQQRLTVTVAAEERLPPLGDDLRVLLFQFVRELLFNIVKHAAVSTALVTLATEDDHLRIEVSDQG